MKLSFARTARSISAFENTELPDFTVLTGLNGAGKTHLLRNIKDGDIAVEGISRNGVHYYDLLSYQLEEPPKLNHKQIVDQANQAWDFLQGQGNRPKRNWRLQAENFYNRIFGESTVPDRIAWQTKEPNHPDTDKFEQYEREVEEKIFQHGNFKKIS